MLTAVIIEEITTFLRILRKKIITNVMEIVVDATREAMKDVYVNSIDYDLMT